MLKLPEDEIIRARGGRASDAKADAAVVLARKVAVARGAVKDTDLAEARAAGLSDAELVEVVGHVALNVYTNYLNEVFGTEIDFPVVTAERVAEPA
jgi:alkylhydroperoxidase family enzyme